MAWLRSSRVNGGSGIMMTPIRCSGRKCQGCLSVSPLTASVNNKNLNNSFYLSCRLLLCTRVALPDDREIITNSGNNAWPLLCFKSFHLYTEVCKLFEFSVCSHKMYPERADPISSLAYFISEMNLRISVAFDLGRSMS
jgi:hypothetical protein